MADFDGTLYRVQVKRGYVAKDRPNSAKVELRRKNRDGKNRSYSEGDYDAIAVYVAEEDEVCWIWPDEIDGEQFSIYIGDYESLRPANKAQVRKLEENKLRNKVSS